MNIVRGLLFILFAVFAWLSTNKANKTGVFVIKRKTIRREDGAGYFRFVIGL